ncbi:MAG: Rieske 2Fe-2S domain-containing protein [Anaerolineales bacterium]|nr:Rieske 2Fe-2S domain-containing protein [Anaerolineales bacterium]MCB8951040.1 Rieske 2Fe-2S domain-containing protein [Ardenticatenales bacterium]
MATATMNAGGMTRREFLFYIWGASMALFTVEFGGLLVWFLIPRFREGEFGGKFTVKVDSLPKPNDPPANFPDGRFWLVNLDTNNPEGSSRMYLAPDETEPIVGVAAIYKVCTHLGCIYAWNTANDRFECPCHGSKYRLDGRRVESPAPRSLDRFELSALDESGNILATADVGGDNFYTPLVLPANTASLSVDTGARKQGPSQPLLCSFRGNCP